MNKTPCWISLLTDGLHVCNPAFAAEFRHWLWPPGSCFLDEQLWWGKHKQRLALHEGVDLVCFLNQQEEKQWLAPGLLVPAIFPGRVVQLQQDFLNWSLYIRHDAFCRDEAVLHTVYGHVQPSEELCIGQNVIAGDPAAVLAAYPHSSVPLHLHVTVAWIPRSIPSHRLNWQMLSEHEQIVLLDPLSHIQQTHTWAVY
ncbi:MAG: hypothetical protein D3909_11010 [Candidatus Electrothrix sp. ATG1]|nr:hypothetical protein [Candidatus Electrothrix sp. ATG1]